MSAASDSSAPVCGSPTSHQANQPPVSDADRPQQTQPVGRYITRKVTEHDILRALERGLENAPLSFSLTDGQVAHLTRSAATARENRIRRELRQGRPIRIT